MTEFLIDDREFNTPLYGPDGQLKTRTAIAPKNRRTETSIHTVADAQAEKIAVAVRYAFAKGRGTISKEALVSAILAKDRVGVYEAMVGVSHAVAEALREVLPQVYEQTVKAGGEAGLSLLEKQLRGAEFRTAAPTGSPVKKIGPFAIRFDVTNPKVVEFVQQHVAETIDNLEETTKQDIRDAIESSLDGDLTLREMTQDIMDSVGDDDRAVMIAKTESMDAANQGLLASWDQAADEGLLTGDEYKEWIATETGACDICEELDGETVPIDEDFSSGDDAPPAHPNCRCTLGIAASRPDEE